MADTHDYPVRARGPISDSNSDSRSWTHISLDRPQEWFSSDQDQNMTSPDKSTIIDQPPPKEESGEEGSRLLSAGIATSTTELLSKRIRLQFSSVASNTAKHSLLPDLPLEIIAEILWQTHSFVGIFSVARTCKTLCAKLINPEATFIWRSMRIALGLPGEDFNVEFDPGAGGELRLVGVYTCRQYFQGTEQEFTVFCYNKSWLSCFLDGCPVGRGQPESHRCRMSVS
ncbi:hypothetical protein P691DRAFT_763046 [Macrolepiota fuliginosa MF-IS2]|uniref:F-box domain-containing protein n=1 Tax=Macrolepiota fuliginosa MF-IS2 TaxID=1400762 RepID=A0A9P6C0Y6_9AGAR|nr:hypothetical protein P691DRAFT_763046 [Macrolepiota fuliginosa MF-IS2]